MSDNKKYYYLKLKDDFFERPEIKVLESMQNGYKYSNLLLKLILWGLFLKIFFSCFETEITDGNDKYKKLARITLKLDRCFFLKLLLIAGILWVKNIL